MDKLLDIIPPGESKLSYLRLLSGEKTACLSVRLFVCLVKDCNVYV